MPDINAFEGPELNKKRGGFYHGVLKNMIARLELEGTLATRKEIGRSEKGRKYNQEKDADVFYDLDDKFIDDNELMC